MSKDKNKEKTEIKTFSSFRGRLFRKKDNKKKMNKIIMKKKIK